MFKALIIGDVHYRAGNPRSRLDDYQEAITAKLLECFELAQEHKVDVILQPGDLFDSPGLAWDTVKQLALVLKKAPCPFLTIPGTHDTWAHNLSTLYRTPFSFLSALEIIHDVTEERGQGAVTINDVIITGHGYNHETDTATGTHQFMPGTWSEKSFSIHLVHAMLLDHVPVEGMKHTLISQVDTTADVIVAGHIHYGLGNSYVYQRDDDVLFINPGALCRKEASLIDMERTVQVALLTVKDGQATAELIPLTSARPGHEVLSREHIESAQEMESRIDEFLKLLASEGEAKFLEVREIVEDLAARESIPAEVKSEALRRIGAAREALGGEAS
jgi:exonuclease SbcD